MNVDFADVRTAMKDSGVALIGIGRCNGENRAEKAVNQAISSPLLNDNNIRGAKNVLVNIMMGEEELKVSEVKRITEIVLEEVGNVTGAAGNTAKPYIKTGVGKNPQLGEDVTVSIIATGFEMGDIGITDGAAPAQPPRPPVKVKPEPPEAAEVDWRRTNPPINIIMEEEEELESGREYGGTRIPHGAAGAAAVKPKIPTSRIPHLLDPKIPDDEIDRPVRPGRKTKASRKESEIASLFLTNDKWEQTPASYINGKPD
jgi:hypothetical protein